MEELILKTLQGRATDEEHSELARWRAAADANERAYQDAVALWRVTAAYPVQEETYRAPTAADLDTARERTARSRWARWSERAAAVAAAVVIGFFAGQHWTAGDAVGPATEFITGAGERAAVSLADGSVVRLGPDTRIRVPGGDESRSVILEGQAFFAVTRGTTPFRVHTPAGDAVVLGTRFDLHARDDSMKVVVVEGRVAVQSPGGRVEVGGHEIAHVQGGALPTVTAAGDVLPLVAWLGSFHAFEATPMREVGRELEARYGLHVRIEDEALAEREVTGLFTDQPPTEIVALVCRVIQARCEIATDTVVMRLPGDAPATDRVLPGSEEIDL